MARWRKCLLHVRCVDCNNWLAIGAVFTIVLWSILLAGCSSSNGLREIYLLSISYQTDTASPSPSDPLQLNPKAADAFFDLVGARNNSRSSATIQQINIGFVAMCLKLHSGTWLCGISAQDMISDLDENPDADPLNLIWVAENIRTGTLFYGLLIITIVFSLIAIVIFATFPCWHSENSSEGSIFPVRPFPSHTALHACLACFSFSFLLSFIAVLWQHLASASAQALTTMLTYGAVDASVGPAAMVLGWLGVACNGLCTAGLTFRILSQRA